MTHRRKRKRRVINFIWITVLLLAVLLWCFYDSNHNLDIEPIVVELNSLPVEFSGIKIAHISDLHGAQFGKDNSDIVTVLSRNSLDLIIITGDIVDNHEDIPMLDGTASALVSVAPTYYVPGNHEYGDFKSREIFRVLRGAGVVVLRNQSVSLQRGSSEIILLGIDDSNGPADQKPMDDVVDALPDGSFIIMLSYRYERFSEYAALSIPIVFTGHAHGGLIRLPFTDGIIGPGMVLFPKYTNGEYTMGDTTMVTSRGIGNAGRTRRLFNRPHIPIVELVSKGN